jgi:hypothetical protein
LKYTIVRRDPQPLLCEYKTGNLEQDRLEPRYSFWQIENILSTYYEIPKIEDFSDRPKPKFNGWIKAKNKYEKHFQIKLSKIGKKYFKYLFGYRNLNYIIENRDLIKINGSKLKKIRQTFIDNNCLVFSEKHSFKDRKSTKYILSDLFFSICEISKQKKTIIGSDNQQAIIKIIKSSLYYEKGERLKGAKQDYKTLRDAGINKLEARNIVKSKINSRPEGYDKDITIIDYLEKNYKPPKRSSPA